MDLSSLPLLWTQLAILAVIILVAATQLTKSADVIAFKTGLGRSFVGVVLLAIALGVNASVMSLRSIAGRYTNA